MHATPGLLRGRRDGILAVVIVALLLPGLLIAGPGTTSAAPAADELLFVPVLDPEERLERILTGQADILPLPDPAAGTEVGERLAADPRVELLAAPSYRLFHLGFNLRRWPFSNPRFRRAVAHGIDRDGVAAAAFGRYAMPATGYVPEYDPFFEPAPGDERIAFDPDAAAAILQEAGFTLGDGDVRLDPRTKRPLTPLVLLAPLEGEAGPGYRAALTIAEHMRSLGIPVEVEALPWRELQERVARTDFHAYALSWWVPRHPGYLYALFHSSQDVLGGFNTVGIRRPNLDRALDALRFAGGMDEAREAARRVQRILYRELPFVPLFYSPALTAIRTDRAAGLTTMPRYGAADYRHRRGALDLTPVSGDKAEPIRWILLREPRSLNPFNAVDTPDWEILGRIYEPLWALDPGTLEPVPWLARSWTWEREEDEEGGGCRLTFFLRENVTWHDGTPFTSADVQFTFEQAKENRIAGWAGELEGLMEVETPDPYRVVFHFSSAEYWHLYRLDLPILPRHIWEGSEEPQAVDPLGDGEPAAHDGSAAPHADLASAGTPPYRWLVGTGPFVFAGRTEDGAYRLRRYADYAEPAKPEAEDPGEDLPNEGASEDGIPEDEAPRDSVRENGNESQEDAGGSPVEAIS